VKASSRYSGCRVVAVILARNEEVTIGDVVSATTRYVDEVVVMDGHSTDATAEIAKRAGATVYQDPGRGKGSAVRQSLELCDADILVFIDADGSHDAADIPRLVSPLVLGEADLCVGSRFTGGSDELSLSFGQLVRTVGNISMNIAINARWKTSLTDTLNGFRAVRREAARVSGLTEDTHTIEQEMVMKMLRRGFRVINVPAHEYARRAGTSHINIWREWPTFVRCVLANLGPDPPRWLRGGWPIAWAVPGLLCIALALLIPRAAFVPVTIRPPRFPAPNESAALFRLAFLLGGAAFLLPAWRRWRFRPISDGTLTPRPPSPSIDGVSGRSIVLALVGISLLGAVLRLWRLDTGLWLDEITPILMYGRGSALEVVFNYASSNNHLLNTLLVNLAVSLFGEHDWVIRLPAAGFGIATVPLFYWVARVTLSGPASLGAALLLAVSYHHVFFSQDARGYTAYLFFSLLATGLYARALYRDRLRTWGLYVMAIVLDLASLLLAAFVLAGHVLVGAAALVVVWRRGGLVTPLARRLFVVFACAGLLVFQLYAAAIPPVYLYMQAIYTTPAAGFVVFSREFLGEVLRGLAAGYGAAIIPLAAIGLVVMVIGLAAMTVRSWPLALGLLLPGLLQAIAVGVGGLVASPRFFILALPLALLAIVQGVVSIGALAARFVRRPMLAPALAAAAFLVMVGVSALQLPRYYSIPKQDYRGSVSYLRTRAPDEIVIIIDVAESGYRYYVQRHGLDRADDYFYVRSMQALDDVLRAHPEKRAVLVTTFPRAFALAHSDLHERVWRDWTVVRRFPGTIGDGDIAVWRPRGSLAVGAATAHR
jgi:mannosyltransferase